MKAMLLAAGRGVRMGQLTAAMPKPLLAVAGQTLIDRNLAALAAAGITEVVINLSYRGDQIRRHVGSGDRYGLTIRYSQEPEPPLETAGGIVQALPLLGRGPFVLLNADVVTDFDIASLKLRRRTIVLVPNPPHHPAGDFCLGSDGEIAATGDRLTFSGLSVLDTELFEGLEPGPRPLKSVLDAAIRRRELRGMIHRGLWLDVGTPERLADATRRLDELDSISQ